MSTPIRQSLKAVVEVIPQESLLLIMRNPVRFIQETELAFLASLKSTDPELVIQYFTTERRARIRFLIWSHGLAEKELAGPQLTQIMLTVSGTKDRFSTTVTKEALERLKQIGGFEEDCLRIMKEAEALPSNRRKLQEKAFRLLLEGTPSKEHLTTCLAYPGIIRIKAFERLKESGQLEPPDLRRIQEQGQAAGIALAVKKLLANPA